MKFVDQEATKSDATAAYDQLEQHLFYTIRNNDVGGTRRVFQLLNVKNYIKPYHFEVVASSAAANGDHTLAKNVWTALQQRLMTPSDQIALRLTNTFLQFKNIEKAREVLESLQDKSTELYYGTYAQILGAEHKMDELVETYRNIPDSHTEAKKSSLHIIAQLIAQSQKQSTTSSSSSTPATTSSDNASALTNISVPEASQLILSELSRLNIRPTRDITRHWIRSIKTLQDAVDYISYCAQTLGHEISLTTLEKIIASVDGAQLPLVWHLSKLQYLLTNTGAPSARVALEAFRISAREADPVAKCAFETILMKELVTHWKTTGLFVKHRSVISHNQASDYAKSVRAALPNLKDTTLSYFTEHPSRSLLNASDREEFSNLVHQVSNMLSTHIQKFKIENGRVDPKSVLTSALEL